MLREFFEEDKENAEVTCRPKQRAGWDEVDIRTGETR